MTRRDEKKEISLISVYIFLYVLLVCLAPLYHGRKVRNQKHIFRDAWTILYKNLFSLLRHLKKSIWQQTHRVTNSHSTINVIFNHMRIF